MRKIAILITIIIAVSCQQINAQESQTATVYPVVIQFQSECCGVPDDGPLRQFIRAFKKKNKIRKITAYHIGPMGKEGEYHLAFPLKELNKKQKVSFAKRLRIVTKSLKDKGRAEFVQQMKIDITELGRATIEKEVF